MPTFRFGTLKMDNIIVDVKEVKTVLSDANCKFALKYLQKQIFEMGLRKEFKLFLIKLWVVSLTGIKVIDLI